MNELIKVNEETETVSARDLHEALEVKERFSLWANRYADLFADYGVTSVGLPTKVQNNGGVQIRELEDFNLPLDLAKHICMMTRTNKGKECRQYFIDLEKAWNSPEQIMARALKVANKTIESLKLQTEEMKPKADYFDAIVDHKLNLSFTETAKEIGVRPSNFIAWLQNNKYIFKDKKGIWQPYQKRMEQGLFEVKDYTSRYSEHSGTQTVVTPKGRQTFRMLLNPLEDESKPSES